MTTYHPVWYYKYFDDVFGRSDYYFEVALSNRAARFQNKNVAEIGAGTGNHAVEILKFSPQTLVLIDNDSTAVDHLHKRFIRDRRVSISLSDGFDLTTLQADIVLCFYSIVQNTASPIDFQKRIDQLLTTIIPNSVLIFEVIDTVKHRSLYPNGKLNKIHDSESKQISISTHYYDNYMMIRYSGYIDHSKIDYQVPLVYTDQSGLRSVLESRGFNVSFYPIDTNGRRLLVRVQTPTAA